MLLVADASILIPESLRMRGRELLAHTDLDLFIAADAWSETEHELRKRVALLIERGHLAAPAAQQLLSEALAVATARVALVRADVYADRMEEAKRRVARDPADAPTVALALALDCAIWTSDYDFFGCGLPVWTTDTLRLHFDR